MGSSGVMAVNPGLYSKLPYDPVKDFAPITVAVTVPLFLVANPNFPPNTVKELVAYAKANPGKVNYASGGSGVTNHLAMELFKSVAGVDMVHVPYKGGPPALTDLIAGQVNVMFETGPGALPHVKSGKLKAIAVGGSKRSAAMPNLPTVAESGYPGFEAVAWIGISAPTGTPKEIITKLNSEIVKIVHLPDIKERFLGLGAESVGNTPEEFATNLKAEIAIMLKSLHHVPMDRMDRAMQEIRRVLKPRGCLYVSEPAFAGPFNEIVRIFHDEGVVRAAAHEALKRAVASGHMEDVGEIEFDMPLAFQHFDDFYNKIVRVTHSELVLVGGKLTDVRQRFEKHLTSQGARFVRPMRVNVLRMPG